MARSTEGVSLPGGGLESELPAMSEINIRELAASEWREYRDLRLRALKDSPDAFSATYADAQARSDGIGL